MCKTSGMNCAWQLLEIPLQQTSIMVDDTGNNLAVGRNFGVYPLLWEYRCINQTVWIVSNGFWKYRCDNKRYARWLRKNAMCCGNIMARAMILNNSVELNRKSSCDETGSIVAGGRNARVLSVWREIDMGMMLRKKWEFCIRTVSSDRIDNRLQ